MPATRNVDPEVGKARALLGNAVIKGDEEAAERYRQELHDLKALATAEKLLAQLDKLSPEKVERIRALLGGA